MHKMIARTLGIVDKAKSALTGCYPKHAPHLANISHNAGRWFEASAALDWPHFRQA